MFEFLMSEKGEHLLWNILICISACGAFWMVLAWIKKRDRELKAEKEKRSRVFTNEIAHLKETFAECRTRRELMEEELNIDSFKWYWLNLKSTDEVNRAVKELYKAYYSRLDSFSKIAKD